MEYACTLLIESWARKCVRYHTNSYTWTKKGQKDRKKKRGHIKDERTQPGLEEFQIRYIKKNTSWIEDSEKRRSANVLDGAIGLYPLRVQEFPSKFNIRIFINVLAEEPIQAQPYISNYH